MRKLATSAVFFVLLAAAACNPRGTTVYNTENVPLNPPPKATMQDIERTIIRAGMQRGWAMRPVGPGEIEGRLSLRSHVAIVDIPYTRNNFSIVYKDSTNLNYDGTNIHKNYNSWVHNLENDIQREVATLTPSR